MLHCCTSDLKRRIKKTAENFQVSISVRDWLTIRVDAVDRAVALSAIAALTLLTTLYLYVTFVGMY
jgi:hypothetical protein